MQDLYIEWTNLKMEISSDEDLKEINTINTASIYFSVFFKIIGTVFFFISAFIIVAEITIFVSTNVSLFGILINNSSNFYIMIIIAMIPLIYLINTTMYSLFNLKLSGVYGIYNNKQTDCESLLLLSSFMCRIAFPLALNFLQILKLNTPTTIEKIMGSTNLIPILGHKFTIFYPIILGILCIFNYFDLFGKMLTCLGLSAFGFENEATNDTISEGNLIFERSKFLN